MPNDAKLGLVVGVCVVLLIAVVFFRKDPAGLTAAAPGGPAPSAQVRPPTAAPPVLP